jgi:glycosyltransferase involved in cell wall biosynthesis
MRILHLPYNIASQIQIVVRALRKAGYEARGMQGPASVIHSGQELEVLNYSDARRFTPAWFRTSGAAMAKAAAAIIWADVVHYHFGGSRALTRDLDLKLLAALQRLRIITFWGTDIRVADIEFQENPFFRRVYPEVPKWAYLATYENSRRIQEPYARAGFHCVLGSESMLAHVDRKLFPEVHLVRGSLDPTEFVPAYPDPERRKPLIIHSPSDPLVKGTKYVLEAVEQLHRRGLQFDFQTLTGVPRHEMLAVMGRCDIYLDQFVAGAYGMVAIEAMAMGKPVLCYIKPSLVQQYPASLPIVNTTVDDLATKLEEVIVDGELRHRLGRLGREFVLEYHDVSKQVVELTALYRRLMASGRNGTH